MKTIPFELADSGRVRVQFRRTTGQPRPGSYGVMKEHVVLAGKLGTINFRRGSRSHPICIASDVMYGVFVDGMELDHDNIPAYELEIVSILPVPYTHMPPWYDYNINGAYKGMTGTKPFWMRNRDRFLTENGFEWGSVEHRKQCLALYEQDALKVAKFK